MSTKIKIFTVIYIFIIVGIVVLANYKSTQYLLRFGGGIPYFDKIAHFFLMGGFAFFVNLVLKARSVSAPGFRYLLGSIIVFAVVTIEEFSQIWVSGRAFDPIDLVADYLGIFIFGEIARFVYNRHLLE